MSAEHIGRDLPGAAIGHVVHLDTGLALKQFIEQLRLRSDRDGRVANRTGVLLCVDDELAERLVWQVLIRHQRDRLTTEISNVGEILEWVERYRRENRIDDEAAEA